MSDRPDPCDVTIRFWVPASSESSLLKAVERASATTRARLLAVHFETEDRRLARAGISWRMEQHGRRRIQVLEVSRGTLRGRVTHAAVATNQAPDPRLHAGSAEGERLIGLLQDPNGQALTWTESFRCQVLRVSRRLRARGAVVDLRFDRGSLVTPAARLQVRELEIALVSGSPSAMFDLAGRWQRRFELVLEPQDRLERGALLAQGGPVRPVRKSEKAGHGRGTSALRIFVAVLDECLSQIARNAIGLVDGEAAHRAEHVHQLRVAIRRLRSALRAFRGCVPDAPEVLVAGLRHLFAELGRTRDVDVLDSGVKAELARAGAPILDLPRAVGPVQIHSTIAGATTQSLLLGWLSWREELAALAAHGEEAGVDLGDVARRRLKRWHARIGLAARNFASLDEPELHELRKRVKRMRYAVEFLAPVLRRGPANRYQQVLAVAQESLGLLNDLHAARTHYLAMVATEPAAWFALGWLAARIAQARDQARVAVTELAAKDPPRD